jgi:CSLREA domain-containing protein
MLGTSTKRPARDRALVLGLLLAALLLLSLLAAKPAHTATFTVNGSGDAPDANMDNGVCDSNAFVPGNQCTLRAAIQEANGTAGADTIDFDIGGATFV